MDLIKYKSYQWLNIPEVDKESVDFLHNKFHFHSLDLEDCLSDLQRSKIDEYDKYLFIVLHFPYYSKKKGYFVSKEVDIFLSPKYIITIFKNGEFPVMSDLLKEMHDSLKVRKEYLSKGPSFFLYKLLSKLFDNIFPKIDRLNREISTIEDTIFAEEGHMKNILQDVMRIKRNLINMRRILLPQRSVIAALEHKSARFNQSDLDIYFDDIVDRVEKLWSNLETSKEVLLSLQDTYESMISHNINNVMKLLTVFSVIMLPLTLISGIYGMNIDLPLQGNTTVFIGLMLLMLLVALIMLAVFRWKRWL